VFSLTYVSSATELLSVPQLVDLLEEIRPRNGQLALTGMLLYSGGNIIQALEGPDAAVESIFSAIESDPRHADVTVLQRGPVGERAFEDWSMGFRNVSEREVRAIEGYDDFVGRPVGQGLGKQSVPTYELLEMFRASC
jgi:Sensors of blue-light using FAD